MKILCVTNIFPNPFQPNKGIYNWRHFSLLQQQASLRVISPVLWTDELRWFCRERSSFCDQKWRDWDGVPVAFCRYYYTPWLLRNSYGSFFELSIRKLFRQAVADFRPDLVYACWPYPDGWAACRLAKEYGLPVAIKVHGSDLLMLDHFPGRKPGTARAMQAADAVLGVGGLLCETAVKLGARRDRCHVVYEGTDHKLFHPGDRAAARRELGLAPEVKRLLFVGNLVSVKKVTHLIDACRLLLGDGIQFEADIIGDGPLREALCRQIETSGLTELVRLRGRRSPQELPAWYRAADLVVLPSDSEGVPNVLMEAAACGIPFVATRVGCIPEIAHFVNSELVPPGDPAALARGIQKLLTNGTERAAERDPAGVPSVAGGAEHTLRIFSSLLAAQKARSESATTQAAPIEESIMLPNDGTAALDLVGRTTETE